MAITVTMRKTSDGICRRKNLWRQLTALSEYAQLCPLVTSVRILEQTSCRMRSEWFVTFGGAPFSWVQIDTVDFSRMEITSEAVCGDFASFRMQWNIIGTPGGGLSLNCSLWCEPDAPLIELNCGEALRRDLETFIGDLITAVFNRAAEKSRDERLFKRVQVDYPEAVEIEGNVADVQLADFSRGGMGFRLIQGKLDSSDDSVIRLRINGVTTDGHLYHDTYSGTHRLSFTHPLREHQFRDLFFRWSGSHTNPDEVIRFYEVMQAPASTGVRIGPRTRT